MQSHLKVLGPTFTHGGQVLCPQGSGGRSSQLHASVIWGSRHYSSNRHLFLCADPGYFRVNASLQTSQLAGPCQEVVVSTGLSSPAPPKATAACLDTCRLQLVRKNAFQITASVSASRALLSRPPSLSHAHPTLPQFHPVEKAVGHGWEAAGAEPSLALCLPQNLAVMWQGLASQHLSSSGRFFFELRNSSILELLSARTYGQRIQCIPPVDRSTWGLQSHYM